MLEFLSLVQECAPTVAPQTMAAVVHVESGQQPYAIGVVGGRLARQPATRDEALATARQLASKGWNFSVGVAQINRYNLARYDVPLEQAFDVCTNLRVGAKILEDCYVRASRRMPAPQAALQAAFSCYYSGNFSRGFKPDQPGQQSYVQKVLASTGVTVNAIPVVPSIQAGKPPGSQVDKEAGTRGKAARPGHPAGTAATPPDNTPVLLRQSHPADGETVRGHSMTRDISNPVTTGEQQEAHRPVIVF